MHVGALVKPSRRLGGALWRLGVIEGVRADGRCKVRSYVAPPHSYEGSAAVYRPDELVEVPRAKVVLYLRIVRAEAEQRLQLVRQIEAALEATKE